VARRFVITIPRAQRQIAAAREWWRDNREKAPRAFDEELESAIVLIVEHPAVGIMVRGTRRRGARRLYLTRIRYYLYYEVSANAILILALNHVSRGHPPRL